MTRLLSTLVFTTLPFLALSSRHNPVDRHDVNPNEKDAHNPVDLPHFPCEIDTVSGTFGTINDDSVTSTLISYGYEMNVTPQADVNSIIRDIEITLGNSLLAKIWPACPGGDKTRVLVQNDSDSNVINHMQGFSINPADKIDTRGCQEGRSDGTTSTCIRVKGSCTIYTDVEDTNTVDAADGDAATLTTNTADNVFDSSFNSIVSIATDAAEDIIKHDTTILQDQSNVVTTFTYSAITVDFNPNSKKSESKTWIVAPAAAAGALLVASILHIQRRRANQRSTSPKGKGHITNNTDEACPSTLKSQYDMTNLQDLSLSNMTMLESDEYDPESSFEMDTRSVDGSVTTVGSSTTFLSHWYRPKSNVDVARLGMDKEGNVEVA